MQLHRSERFTPGVHAKKFSGDEGRDFLELS
jgi:hypothetical protein